VAQCPNFAALNRGRHLYLAGRPSRWALAHISSVVLGLVSSAKTLAGKNISKCFILCLSSLLMNLNYRSLMCSCHSIVFTHAMLPSAGISCRRVSVPPSFTSWCSTEMAKRRITQTMPHDSPGTLVSDDEYLHKTQTLVTPNGGTKCWCDRSLAAICWLSTESVSTYLSRKFITLSIHLICLQHVRHDAAHRTGLSATADSCTFQLQHERH